MNIKTLCILGGTGFVGRHLLNRLSREGYELKVLTRHRERHRDLLVIPTLSLIEADVHDPRVLKAHFAGCQAVINLVGILNDRHRDGRGFYQVHVELPRKVIEACRENGIQRLLHMSALNADPQGPSLYLRTKGEGEALVQGSGLKVTSFRPSVIFGPEDHFYNRFATLLKLSPLVFPLACPRARMAPVYVGDVVCAYATALKEPATVGQRYDLCGPHVHTLQEIVAYTRELLGVRRLILPLNDRLSYAMAWLLDRVPGKPFSIDNYRTLQVDSVCQGPFPEVFGIAPTPEEAVVPKYLAHHTVRARYHLYRRTARRDHA